jgi:RNA polymerase sigma-70 factor (ECF subfamily)
MLRSDEEIIAAVRAGHVRSFAELIDRYKDRSFALAMRMLRNPRDAEEAAQDAFLRAYGALETFRGESSFGTWFYRILYNGCVSRLKRSPRDQQAWEREDAEPAAGADASPLERLERDDLVSRLRTAIDRLPPKYATVLTLFYLQERTHDEICTITELPLTNVKVHLHRARLLLTKQLRREALYDEVVS